MSTAGTVAAGTVRVSLRRQRIDVAGYLFSAILLLSLLFSLALLVLMLVALYAVQVDELDARVVREPAHPGVDVVRGEGEPLALHQLDDLSALEIDGRNEHGPSEILVPQRLANHELEA